MNTKHRIMKKFGVFLASLGLACLSVFNPDRLQAQTNEKLDTLRMEFGRSTGSTGFSFAAAPGTYDIYWNGTKQTVNIQSDKEYKQVNRTLSADNNTVLLCATDATGHITHFKPYNTSYMTSIDVSGCPSLVYLDCSGTKLTTLEVENLENLDTLICSGTQITDLNVSSLTKLSTLKCSNTSITNLDVSGLKNLTTVAAYSNRYLNTINAAGCTALSMLKCYGSYSIQNLKSLDVSGCTALKELDCSYSQLTALDVSGCKALQELSCYSTQITDLDVSVLTNLTTVEAYSNDYLNTINAAGCTALSVLKCYGNYSIRNLKSLDVSGCTALKELYCSYSRLTALDVSDCELLESLDCSASSLEVLYVSNCSRLQKLYCNGTQLSFLNLSGCSALTTLNCDGTRLTELDLSNNPALKTVYCSSSSLKALNVSGCTELKELSCYGAKIKALDLSTNMALQNLDCHSTSLTSLDLSQHTALQTLNCYSNSELAELTLTGCTGLTILNAYSNRILPSLDLSTCSSLITFEGYGNEQLTNLNLSGCKALTTIKCNDNTSLQSIQLTGCSALVYLAVKNTQLQDLDLSPCPDFRELYCQNSQFSMRKLSALAPQTKIAALSPQTIPLTLLAGEPLDLRDELNVNAGTTSCKVFIQNTGEEAAPEYYTMGEGEDYGLISLKKLETFRIELKNTTFVNKDGKLMDPVEVNYVVRVIGIPEHLDKPTFSVLSDTVAKGTKVSLSCSFVDAKIYYTLDESDPTNQSILYEKPITIREDMVIRAIAILGPVKSDIAEATYVVNVDIPEAPDTIATPTFSVPGGAVERGTEVEIHCATKAVRIYYTLDGSTPTAGSREYKEPIVINTAGTLRAFAVGGSLISEIASVYYSIKGVDPNAPVVAAPVFSIEDGEVEKGTTVSLSCATEGAKIYYRADGSDPSEQSWEYTSPITINSSVTIKAIAVIEHLISEITTATYTVKGEDPNAPRDVATPVFSHSSGAIAAGTEVSLSCATNGAQIYYTLNGSTPTKQSLKYKDPIVINTLTTIRAIAFMGNETSLEAMAIYTIKGSEGSEISADSSSVATPVFSLPSGNVEMGTNVSLTCVTQGAQIYYTLDGSTPTRHSIKYKNPISIRNTSLIKAIAIKGNEVSLEAMAIYTVAVANETESVLANICSYPNPNNGTFFIELPIAATIEVMTLNGILIQRMKVGAGTQALNIKQSGLYILRITADGATKVQRVLVR